MYIDRRYRGRRRRSPWPWIILLFFLAGAGYVVLTRTSLIANPLKPQLPSPTPTRSALSYLAEAEDRYKAGALKDASSAYQRVAELEPENDEAHTWQARLWVLRGHPDKALPEARQAVAIKPSAYNMAILAMALDWNEQYDEAIQIALKAVDKDPLLAEAHAYLAEVYADKNNWARALDEAEAAVKLKSNSAIVQRNLGYVLERQGRYKEAIEAYNKAADLDPRLGIAYLGAGNSYLAQNDTGNALAQFQRAADALPDSPVGLDELGRASALSGDTDKALSVLRKAAEIDPSYGMAVAHLGWVYYQRLNWEAAIENFKRAVDLGVNKEEYLYELGLSYANLEDCGNAIVWLQKALKVNPNSKPAQDGLKACSKG